MVEYSLAHAAVLQLQVSHTPNGATRDILSVGIDRITQVLTDALGAIGVNLYRTVRQAFAGCFT